MISNRPTILERTVIEITWKPLYFLRVRNPNERRNLAKDLVWDKLVECCLTVAAKCGSRLAAEEDLTTNRIYQRKAIADYCSLLVIKSMEAMPAPNAIRQSAKIHKCLMGWRGFVFNTPSDNYVRTLSHRLAANKKLERDEATEIFNEFSSLSYWKIGKIQADTRRQTIRLREFIDIDCARDFSKAREFVTGQLI